MRFLDDQLDKFRKRESELTVLRGETVGVDLVADNRFVREYFEDSGISYIFCAGKMNGATYTDANLLIPKRKILDFVELFVKYAKKYELEDAAIEIEEDWDKFTEKIEGIIKCLRLDDGVETCEGKLED